MEYSIFDAHCDTLCCVRDEGKSIFENNCQLDLARMKKYKSYTQVFGCYINPIYRERALERCLDLIDAYYSGGLDKSGMILSMEGGEPIYDLAALRNFYRLGVRIIALTWNFSNHIAAGVHEPDKTKGLTEFGRQVVEEMNHLGILADASHLNDKSFYDIAELTEYPFIATHSNSRAVCAHPRNLTDEQFKVICESGGCAGINLYPPFLNESKNADLDDIIRHIEHFMALGGENHIGIGADFDGVSYLPEGFAGCEDLYKIFDRLLQMNYTEEQIEKISCKNFKRVLKGVL